MTILSIIGNQKLKRPPFCAADISVFEAAVMIALLDINALAVVDKEKLVGIITDHDILMCLADCGSDFHDQIVGDWMTEKPTTCTASTNLSTALNLMAKHDIRNLVVTKRGHPITVVSSKEILARIHEEDELELKVLRDKTRDTQNLPIA